MKRNLLAAVAIIAGILLIILPGCKTIPKGVKAVKPFDPAKYMGRWYEIARMDFRFERNLEQVTATYTLQENGIIRVDNRGYDTVQRKWKQSIGRAKASGTLDEGKLKVSFFGPFYAGYNVIAIDPDYQYALIAGKNRKYLWLLSRQKTVPEEIRESYLRLASQYGYNTKLLVWPTQ